MAAMTDVASGGRTNSWLRVRKQSTPYVYLIPALIVMGIITFYPLGFQVWMSLTDYGLKNLRLTAPAPTWVGLTNYISILKGDVALSDFSFWRMLAFNLFWTVSNVVLHVAIGILIAVALNVNGVWFKGIYRAIYILPIVLPQIIIAAVWRNMYDPDNGAINQLLASVGHWFGMSAQAFHIRWIAQVDPPIPFIPLTLSYFALLFCNIWLGWPFMTIVATGALQSIPGDLYEAASIDGATSRQSFFKITVPLLRPAMIPAAVYGIVATFNLFNLIYLMSSGGPLRQTEILVTTAYRLVNEQRLYGIAAAFSIIIFFVLLGLTLITNRITKATERYDV